MIAIIVIIIAYLFDFFSYLKVAENDEGLERLLYFQSKIISFKMTKKKD